VCGIAGMVRFAGLKPSERSIGARMAACLRHRGPDDAGHFCDAIASLGHRRLSIIDFAGGRQPASNEDGSIQVVFNGEIYNYESLANQLRARGHTLRSRCDTEVIVHLYEEHGESFVEHLNGMFAIALWDTRQRKLILVRDRLGIKPLYYHDDGRRIVFGSELKALLAAGDVPRRIDPCAVQDYLTFGHIPAPRTIFDSVRKLEPAFLAVCSASGVALRRWWDIPFGEEPAGDPQSRSADQRHHRQLWVDQFAELLTDAVRLRRMADVPLGAFLSGGIDSTAVVAAMAREPIGAVLTHTVGFDERDHDERDRARLVAERLGTDHHEVMVRPDAAWAAAELVRHFDEPFADSSAVPTYYLSKVARQRVTVALAGDGADEMLAGYRRYRFDQAESAVRRRCPLWLRQSTAGVAGMLYPKGDWLPRSLRAKATLQNLACDDATGHLRSIALLAGTLPYMLLHEDVIKATGGYDPFTRGRELFAQCPSQELLNRWLYMDMKTLLPDDMLTKVDRASMAVGLEVRVPLLDHRLVELAARMPTELKLNAQHHKSVLRQTVSRWLGPTIANRPKKGFDVPLDAWFRSSLRELVQDTLTGSNTFCRTWIKPSRVQRLLKEHHRGWRSHGHILWTLLSLERWTQVYANDIRSLASAESADVEGSLCGVGV